MKKSNIKSFDEFPMFLNAEDISEALGIAISTTYELMNRKASLLLKSAGGMWWKEKNLSSGYRKTQVVVLELHS